MTIYIVSKESEEEFIELEELDGTEVSLVYVANRMKYYITEGFENVDFITVKENIDERI